MFFLVYVSSATQKFSQEQLLSLLETCRKENVKRQVTGMLLYKEGNFMQVLEGEEEVVRALYSKLIQDTRHFGSIILLEGEEEVRQFPDWSMGFCNLSDNEVQKIEGYSNFMDYSFTGAEYRNNPHECYKLLMVFKKNNR